MGKCPNAEDTFRITYFLRKDVQLAEGRPIDPCCSQSLMLLSFAGI